MAIELKIPNIGESITEVQIAEWLKADGDEVKKDENIAMLDSEKSTLELPAPESGRLKILHRAGDTVKVGEIVGRIETDGAPEKSKTMENKAGNKEKPEAQPETKRLEKKESPDKAVETKKERSPASEQEQPGQRPPQPRQPVRKQPEQNVNTGEEGPEGQATKTENEEVPAPEQEQPGKNAGYGDEKPAVQEAKTKKEDSPPPVSKVVAGREEEVVPMTMLRRTAAKRLVEAKQQMAMLTTFNEADMSAVLALRAEHQEAFQERHRVKLGLMSFFVKALIDALKQFPQLNAEIRGYDVVYRDYFDIGVAIASERGLVVPVLRSAERMSFAEIEKAIGDFARRAKDGKLKPADLEGGTFTVTNGGAFGSLLSTPIINPPQTGILGMHTIQERPIALQGQVVIRPMMFLALTYDHRIVDGREAVLFLRRVKEAVENPARMLIEI